AVFAFTATAGLAVATRRRVLAVFVLLVGAGWPATLLGGGGQLLRGSLILAGALVLLAERAPRPAFAAALAVVLAAAAASTSAALARDELLSWQRWDLRSPAQRAVDVTFAWKAIYTGIDFPKRATTVFTATGPAHPHYWRAATLDHFGDDRWLEQSLPRVPPTSRVDFARSRSGRLRQRITIAALSDPHLVGAAEPVAFDTGETTPVEYAADGEAMVAGALRRGERYTAWSDAPSPDPAALARSPARYPAAILTYLDFQDGRPF